MKQKQDNDSNLLCDNQHVSLVTDSDTSHKNDSPPSGSIERGSILNLMEEPTNTTLSDDTLNNGSVYPVSPESEARDGGKEASSSGSPWLLLRSDATVFVSQTLQRGRKNLLQLATSRVAVLLSSSAVCSTSIHQFLKNYEDLNVFILLGESFSGVEAVEFRQKVKNICENYFAAFHRQNIFTILHATPKIKNFGIQRKALPLEPSLLLHGANHRRASLSVGNALKRACHG